MAVLLKFEWHEDMSLEHPREQVDSSLTKDKHNAIIGMKLQFRQKRGTGGYCFLAIK
jgi:hypothetical protein